MNLAWLTDIHLNFLKKNARVKFYQDIVNAHCDAVLLTGDIAEAPDISILLDEMDKAVNKPIYFVLGNHDFYRGRVDDVRNAMIQLTKNESSLYWLPYVEFKILQQDVILVGQDGWADGRFGDFHHSNCSMNCSRMIIDLIQERILGQDKLLQKMQELADADALQLKNNLLKAIEEKPKKIIVLTHIPPFKESAQHQGKMCNDSYLPFFASKATGDILMPIAAKYSYIEFSVLCGHTHSPSFYQPLPNLIIKAGAAEYYRPKIQEIISF